MVFTILIVEDQWQIRKVSTLAFSDFGYRILEAENGREALSLLATEKVDLVLTDWSMPEMNGEEMLVQIRQDRQYKTVPVIVLSAHECLSQSVEELKISIWLRKPCRIRVLKDAVIDVFESLRVPEFS